MRQDKAHPRALSGFRFQRQLGADAVRSLAHDAQPHMSIAGIMRGIESLPLTRRQSQVCRMSANGASYAEIAKQLGISKHTAIAHARWIYDKLDVHNRSELINRLVSRLQ